ncbi:hypothetical protein EJB05_12130, partial [Eragrostis curvula]
MELLFLALIFKFNSIPSFEYQHPNEALAQVVPKDGPYLARRTKSNGPKPTLGRACKSLALGWLTEPGSLHLCSPPPPPADRCPRPAAPIAVRRCTQLLVSHDSKSFALRVFCRQQLLFLTGMSYQSETSSSSDESEENSTIDPRYTMEEYIAEQSVLYNLLEQIGVKLQAKIDAHQFGISPRRYRKFVEKNHAEGHQRLITDFFSEDPVCDEKLFRSRYRLSRPLFLRIVRALGEWSPYFTQRTNVVHASGLSPVQKCSAAIRMLMHGTWEDAIDEYVQIGKSTAVECLERFAEGVIDKFGGEYFRGPASVDLQRLLQIGEDCGFPGMLGSIGCMHWEWENCPPRWIRRVNHSDRGVATIVLEAVASQDLWIWHASFSVIGSINDANVLDQSQFFTEVLNGQVPRVQFSINKGQYDMGYYLASEIYPECSAFVKTIPFPRTEKERLFARYQEEARKDVERAFGVLQSRFPIVRGPRRFFEPETLGKIFQACIILHNMAIEDEKDKASACFDSSEASATSDVLPSNVNTGPADCLANVLQRNATICAEPTHGQLRRDLVEHIWQQFGPFGDKSNKL